MMSIQILIPQSIAHSSSSIHITISSAPVHSEQGDPLHNAREESLHIPQSAQNGVYLQQDTMTQAIATTPDGGKAVNRREFGQRAFQIGSGAFLASHVELLERFAQALKNPSTIDERMLSYLERRTEDYWRDRHGAVLASNNLLDYVIEHFQKVTDLLEGALLPTVRTRLCCSASGIAQLAGHLLFDMGEFAHARQFHQVAISAAREGNNQALEAAAWGRISFTWTYSGNAPEALTCIREARRLAARSANSPVRAYLAAVEAEVQAILGDRESCLKALQAAEQIEDRQYPTEEMYWLRFDHSRLAGYQGICFKRLYHHDDARTHSFLNEAQRALTDALTLLDPARIQRRPTLLIDIAGTYAQQEDVEGACKHATEALSITAQTKSRTVVQRLLTLRSELERWRDTTDVRNLDEQMALLIPLGGYREIA
jgi:tetratricopeptide (TPR) repeat protein